MRLPPEFYFTMVIRFFIIVGFILSLIAAGGSFSIYQSYHTEREQRLEAESKALQLQDAMTAVKADLEEQKSHVADLEEQVEKFKKTEKDFKSQQTSKDAEIDTLKSEIASNKVELAKLQDQLQSFRTKEQMPAPIVKPSSVSMPEIPVSSAVSSGSFQSPTVSTTPSVDNATTSSLSASVPVSPVASTPTVIPAESPAAEDSRILTVNRKFNFIVVNIGLRDGLRMGDKVQVMQGSSQKALAQIEKIYDKFSAATLLNEDKDNPVREGDAVRKV